MEVEPVQLQILVQHLPNLLHGLRNLILAVVLMVLLLLCEIFVLVPVEQQPCRATS